MFGKGACVAGETATEAGSTHPTGMYSCFQITFSRNRSIFFLISNRTSLFKG